jgi:hypothetical protein
MRCMLRGAVVGGTNPRELCKITHPAVATPQAAGRGQPRPAPALGARGAPPRPRAGGLRRERGEPWVLSWDAEATPCKHFSPCLHPAAMASPSLAPLLPPAARPFPAAWTLRLTPGVQRRWVVMETHVTFWAERSGWELPRSYSRTMEAAREPHTRCVRVRPQAWSSRL